MTRTTRTILLGLSSLLTHAHILSMGAPVPQQDPYGAINYRRAFDQSDLHQKHATLMHALGCADNVFPNHQLTTKEKATLQTVTLSSENQAQLLLAYQNACVNRLRVERNWAITAPAQDGALFIALLVCALALVDALTNDNGENFGIAIVILNAMYQVPQMLASIKNFAYPPVDPLNTLEEQFSKDQCLIPRTLWPAIEERFMVARRNPFDQRASTNFLKFALALTLHKPKQPLTVGLQDIENLRSTLKKKIRTFFDDYAYTCDGACTAQGQICQGSCVHQRELIALNVAKFILSLLSPAHTASDMPRYICLQGPAGVGKTHFVEQLYAWIDKLLPNTVAFERMSFSSSNELEGNAQHPGALLCVLRRQLLAQKRGTIVFMDEAGWLNTITDAAKRTFNGERCLQTHYFGDGIEGKGTRLPLPPMLLFVAQNKVIDDPALRNRFDVVQYPEPKPTALAQHAHNILARSALTPPQATAPPQSNLEKRIKQMKIKDFRTVAANVHLWA